MKRLQNLMITLKLSLMKRFLNLEPKYANYAVENALNILDLLRMFYMPGI